MTMMKANDLAPIALFVYNRPWHTEQTLKALKRNELAENSELFIFADGPKANADSEQQVKINEVRRIVKSEQWCGKVEVIEATQNKGLANSIIDGVTHLVSQYGKIIVLEDDLVTSTGFLQYMNRALQLYCNEEKLAGISGYAYHKKKIPLFSSGTYTLPIGCSWGWATWADRWSLFESDAAKTLSEIKRKKLERKFDFGCYPFLKMLEQQANGELDSWAIRFYASFFLKNLLFLYPSHSLVYNAGFDDSGENCDESQQGIFGNKIDHSISVDIEREKVELKPEIVQILKNEFEADFAPITFGQRIKNYLKLFIKK